MERRKKNNIDYQGFPCFIAVACLILVAASTAAAAAGTAAAVVAIAAATIYMPQLQTRLVHCLKRRSN